MPVSTGTSKFPAALFVHSTTKQLGYLDFARITASASDAPMPTPTREPVAPTPEEVGRHISV